MSGLSAQGTIRFIASGAAILLSLALAGGFLNFLFALADSLSHFRFHLSAMLAVMAIILASVRAKVLALIALLVAGMGFALMYPALPGIGLPQQDGSHSKFIQFNTLFNNPKIPLAIEWLKREAPDVLALQEVSSRTRVIYDSMATEMSTHVLCRFSGVGSVAILSKYPKVSERCVEKLGLVWVQVDVDGTPITFASLHLHWPYPYRQWQQLEALDNEFKAMPRPVMLAGDFNAAPWSEAVKRVQQFTSTELVPGFRLTLRKGFPVTGVIPFLPLDHFLIDPKTAAAGVRTGPQIGSDHVPVILRFDVAANNPS